MPVLLDITLPRALDTLSDRLIGEGPRGGMVEAWLFEGRAARQRAEALLLAAGIRAKVHCAYKPLVHFFVEDIDVSTLKNIEIHYPVHSQAASNRFLLEAYPLAAMLGDIPLAFTPGGAELAYTIVLTGRDGRVEERRVLAPNRLRRDHLGLEVLAPTGWLKVSDAEGRVSEGALTTEFETAFERVIDVVQTHPWGECTPYFDVLDIRIDIAGMRTNLPYGHECIDSGEALHEDLYFSLLEVFQKHSNRPAGDRRLQPGQIVPDIRLSDGPTRVRVRTRPHSNIDLADEPDIRLDHARRPLSPGQIGRELARISGTPIIAESRQGRAVRGVVVAGQNDAGKNQGGKKHEGEAPGIVISGGQHANETSGIVGALRAARQLAAEGHGFALIPLENPDGYALHRRLRRQNPAHMHHAARYTALGDDLEYRDAPPFFERAARLRAFEAIGARLHINLHGYPAHEWTRVMSGYVPRGFENWALPKGFFLILRHHPGLKDYAVAFLERLTALLARSEALIAFNRAQLATYRAHTGAVPFAIYNDIPCMISENAAQAVPLTLITEYPDETISGAAFQLAQQTQFDTIIHAHRLFSADHAGSQTTTIA